MNKVLVSYNLLFLFIKTLQDELEKISPSFLKPRRNNQGVDLRRLRFF